LIIMLNLLGLACLLPDNDCLVSINNLERPHPLLKLFIAVTNLGPRRADSFQSGTKYSSKWRGRAEWPLALQNPQARPGNVGLKLYFQPITVRICMADCYVEYYIYTGASGIKETELIKTLQACLVHYLYGGDFVPHARTLSKKNPCLF
jgi:hypothetical protein